MIPLLLFAPTSPKPKVLSCCAAMANFAADPEFMATHARPLPFKFQTDEGAMVSYSGSDGNHKGFYVPAKRGVYTAIVMVHEWWGLNDYIKREAVRLHDTTGYGVLAVDLYKGAVAQDADEAGKLMAGVKPDEAAENVKDAVDDLASGVLGEAYPRLGSIGWCFGGMWSLESAIAGGSKVKACVMYYGMPDDSPAALGRLKAPVLLMEALKDKWITPEVVAGFKTAMSQAHRFLEVVTYDADHAFANPSNPNYKKADAEDAMARSIAFLKKNLG